MTHKAPIYLLLLPLLSCKPQAPKPAPIYTPVVHVTEPSVDLDYKNEQYEKAYEAGYRDGYRGGLESSNYGLTMHHNDYSDKELKNRYLDGYWKGRDAGLEIYRERQDSFFNALKKTEPSKGYKDGYDDGFEDGCENDYKESWNPRSKGSQYLKDYNEGYNEGFESGRLDYAEDVYLEGDFEEDWW